jgi:hypothetical protein
MAVLNQIWTTLSPLTNLFTPQQKLTSKTRTGAKVTKKYDTAQTPYQRLLAHHPGVLDKRRTTTSQTVRNDQPRPGPPRRHRPAEDPPWHGRAQKVTRRDKQNAVYLSRAILDESTTNPPRAS